MVTYQKWTAIVFEVAEQKGADTSRFQNDIVSTAASIWQAQKDHLSTATVAQARDVARRQVSVQGTL